MTGRRVVDLPSVYVGFGSPNTVVLRIVSRHDVAAANEVRKLWTDAV